jgi:hypothetical protein
MPLWLRRLIAYSLVGLIYQSLQIYLFIVSDVCIYSASTENLALVASSIVC